MTTSLPSDLQALVLAKYDAPKGAREAIQPGTYAVDFLVRVKGSITVGEDYEQNITASVPWQQLCAFLLSKVNPTTRAATIREALRAIETGVVDSDTIKAEAEDAVAEIAEAAKKTCKGKVTGKPVVEVVAA